MNYKKENYVNKEVQFYPCDFNSMSGIIVDVDDLGFWIKVTKSVRNAYMVGKTYFFSHCSDIIFKFV